MTIKIAFAKPFGGLKKQCGNSLTFLLTSATIIGVSLSVTSIGVETAASSAQQHHTMSIQLEQYSNQCLSDFQSYMNNHPDTFLNEEFELDNLPQEDYNYSQTVVFNNISQTLQQTITQVEKMPVSGKLAFQVSCTTTVGDKALNQSKTIELYPAGVCSIDSPVNIVNTTEMRNTSGNTISISDFYGSYLERMVGPNALFKDSDTNEQKLCRLTDDDTNSFASCTDLGDDVHVLGYTPYAKVNNQRLEALYIYHNNSIQAITGSAPFYVVNNLPGGLNPETDIIVSHLSQVNPDTTTGFQNKPITFVKTATSGSNFRIKYQLGSFNFNDALDLFNANIHGDFQYNEAARIAAATSNNQKRIYSRIFTTDFSTINRNSTLPSASNAVSNLANRTITFGDLAISNTGFVLAAVAADSYDTHPKHLAVVAFNTQNKTVSSNNQSPNGADTSNIATLIQFPNEEDLSNIHLWYEPQNGKFYWVMKNDTKLYEWNPQNWGNNQNPVLTGKAAFKVNEITTGTISLWSGSEKPQLVYNPKLKEYYIKDFNANNPGNSKITKVSLVKNNNSQTLYTGLLGLGVSMALHPNQGWLYFTALESGDHNAGYTYKLRLYNPSTQTSNNVNASFQKSSQGNPIYNPYTATVQVIDGDSSPFTSNDGENAALRSIQIPCWGS